MTPSFNPLPFLRLFRHLIKGRKRVVRSKQPISPVSSTPTPTIRKSIPQPKQFQNHYVWPERFVARECRSETDALEPASISEIGKNSRKPVFGQIVESREPKENSNGTWNFHFIIGKNGVLVQAWVFGPKEDVISFSEKIRVDEYFVFWGYTVKENKYTSSLSSTSEWGMFISCNSTKFERVIVTKIYQKQEDPYSEEQEIFSNSFRQPNSLSKPTRRARKREHSFEEKKRLLDPSQPKITDYTISSPALILNNSSDSLE